MAHAAPARGCSAEDLDWLRDELGIAHLELDPWGSLIVSPATDEHESAVAVLHDQVVRQFAPPAGCVRSNGLAWKVPGGSGYVNVADLAVVAPRWTRTLDLHLDPPAPAGRRGRLPLDSYRRPDPEDAGLPPRWCGPVPARRAPPGRARDQRSSSRHTT